MSVTFYGKLTETDPPANEAGMDPDDLFEYPWMNVSNGYAEKILGALGHRREGEEWEEASPLIGSFSPSFLAEACVRAIKELPQGQMELAGRLLLLAGIAKVWHERGHDAIYFD